MNKKRLLVITVCLMSLLCVILVSSFINPSEEKIYCLATIDDEFIDNRVLLVLTQSASEHSEKYTVADFSKYGCTAVTVLNNAMAKNKSNCRSIICLELNMHSKENVLSVIGELIRREDVLYAGTDQIISVCSVSTNDVFLDDQWAIDYIILPQAWDYSTGSSDIVVGVLDTGIDSTHPELSGMIARNLCRDFTSNSVTIETNPVDPNGHGTHVAGIIGATGNNELGIAGVNWSISLASLRVLDSSGTGSLTNILSAINYAESANIPILNLSLGWASGIVDDVAFNTAIEAYSGILVCAAGNDAEDNDGENPSCPASYSAANIISVGAINSSGKRCTFSNYGATSVDIYAPGENILSTYPIDICEDTIVFADGTRLCEFSVQNREYLERLVETHQYTWSHLIENFYSLFSHEPAELRNSTHYAPGYHYMDGTSMSTPYVTGVAALLLCENPQLTSSQLKDAILVGSNTISIILPTGIAQSVKALNALASIRSVHTTHTYREWTYYTNGTHIESCCCGKTGTATAVHAVKESAIVNNKAICLGCGYLLDLNFDFSEITPERVAQVSASGSYILSNGIIVLVDTDLEAYQNGTLVFYNTDDIPATA